MRRIETNPRSNWVDNAKQLGYLEEGSSWAEDAFYEFNSEQVNEIRNAADELHGLCMNAVEHVIDMKYFPLLGIDDFTASLITESWSKDEPSLFGRFDLMYDGVNPPKMLEYNTDTIGTLFESSIMQRNWREQVFPTAGDFNQIHQALVSRWRSLLVGRYNANKLHVTTATPMPEREILARYIESVVQEAGFNTTFIPIQDIGWDSDNSMFVDMDNQYIQQIYKIYPWDWIINDSFSENIPNSQALWLEPAWKILLGHKGLLPILWEMYPYHINLLPAFTTPIVGEISVKKPMVGQEGLGVQILDGNKILEEIPGDMDTAFIYQSFVQPVEFNCWRPNVGAWMVNNNCHGISIRESRNLILDGESRSVPHLII